LVLGEDIMPGTLSSGLRGHREQYHAVDPRGQGRETNRTAGDKPRPSNMR